MDEDRRGDIGKDNALKGHKLSTNIRTLVEMTNSPTTTGSQLGRITHMDDKPKPTLEDWNTPFVTYPCLDILGYVWHPGLKLLFCTLCHSTVTAKGLKSHSGDGDHQYARSHVRKFVNILEGDCEFGIRQGRLPDVGPLGKLPRLQFLDDIMAYQCAECGKLYTRVAGLREHYSRIHASRLPVEPPAIRCQHLVRGEAEYGVMFAVVEVADRGTPGEDGEVALLAQQLQRRIAQALQNEFKANWASKDSWAYLQEVPWHLVVEANHERYDVAQLKEMVTIPAIHTAEAKGTFPTRIAVLVEKAVLKLEHEVRGADFRWKQILGSDYTEIQKGKVFDWLQRATVIRYSRTLAGFVLFLCHLGEAKGSYSVNFAENHDLPRLLAPLVTALTTDEDGDGGVSALHDVLTEIIEYKGTLGEAPDRQYVIHHFLALYHLREDGGFRPPIDVTQALAHMQWCFRLFMFIKVRASLAVPLTEGENEMERIQQGLQAIRAGSFTQMGTIHTQKGILRQHAEMHPRAPLARWDDLVFTRLYCEGKRFDLNVFRSMNASLVKRGWAMLKQLLKDEDIDTEMKWPEFVHDREGNSGDLYSFLLDGGNKFAYLDSPFARKMIEKYFAKSAVSSTIQCHGISTYLSRCRELLNLIAAMMHTTSGGAPRAEEAILTRVLEGPESRRNLFFMRGKLAWILDYNKSKSQTSVARFLPEETSRLIVTYLVLIRPLETLLSSIGVPEHDIVRHSDMLQYLFISDGTKWTANRYRSALEQAFTEEMGVAIGVRQYRQIQAALSGHHLSKWKELEADMDDAALEQQGHSILTHNREYNRIVDQSLNMKMNDQIRFELASIAWQKLVFPGGSQMERRGARENTQSGEEPVFTDILNKSRKYFEIWVPIRVLAGLRRVLHNADATFKIHEQALSTALMLQQSDQQSAHYRKDMLAVLPTGAGKTLTWIVAQSLESRDSVTLVIVPLTAVMMDLKRRLCALGLPVQIATGSSPLELSSFCAFVLTSAERAASSETLLEVHKAEDRINRIVFDEAHLSFTAANYRKVMGLMAGLMTARPPVVLMTGTCSPDMEGPLLQNLGLNTVTTIRCKTDRPEIIYSIHPGKPLPEGEVAAAVAKWYSSHLQPGLVGSSSQVLLYVPYVKMGELLAAKLGGLNVFHAKTPQDEKRRIYEEFRSGQLQTLVATQAFGAGIDIETVDVIIHAGNPRSVVDFSQEVGRGGRGGKAVLSVVFRSEKQAWWNDEDRPGGKQMEEWLSETSKCRRATLTKYLDGEEGSCAALPSGRLCDVCRGGGISKVSVTEEILEQINSRKEAHDKSKVPAEVLGTEPAHLQESLRTPASVLDVTEGSAVDDPSSDPLSGPDLPCKPNDQHRSYITPARPLAMAPNVPQIEWQPSSSAQKRDSAGSPVTPTSRPSSRHAITSSGPAMRQALFASLSGLDPGRSASTAGASGTAKLTYPSASPSVEARTLGTTRPSFSSPSLMDISRTRGLARTTAPSYADRLTELLEPWRRQGAKCYTCVALGQLRDCGRGNCPVERQIMKIEKVKHIKDVVDAHTALVRSSIRHMGYCGECFFPVPALGQTNAFHDLGTGTDLLGRSKPCRIFASMGQKAISCGSHLWREKILGEENAGASMEPLWLRDLWSHARRVPDGGVESFVRIIQSECGNGERWIVRILYHMMQEALGEA